MNETFESVLGELEQSFRRLETATPIPKRVPLDDGFVLRYEEKSIQQALLQKFARYISGLYALDLLLVNGFCQEQGVIQRTLMDIEEDVLFLVMGLKGDWTKRHDDYLEHFWMEGPGAGMVPRDKIRAYVHGTADDPSTATAAGRAVFKAYSGYVHANSVAIVDMCAGDDLQFCLRGMCDNPLYGDHADDAWNYFYGGLVVAEVVASGFEDAELWEQRRAARREFETAHADKLFRPDMRPPWAKAEAEVDPGLAGEAGA